MASTGIARGCAYFGLLAIVIIAVFDDAYGANQRHAGLARLSPDPSRRQSRTSGRYWRARDRRSPSIANMPDMRQLFASVAADMGQSSSEEDMDDSTEREILANAEGARTIGDVVNMLNVVMTNDMDGVEMKRVECGLELQTVDLNVTRKDANGLVMLPTCVRLHRCAGCNMAYGLECRPSKMEDIKIKVMRVKPMTDGKKHVVMEGKVEIVVMKNHTECIHRCMITEDSCSSSQTYDPVECTCPCTDSGLKDMCTGKGFSHFWDDDSCMCMCLERHECGNGREFKETTCSCQNKDDEPDYGNYINKYFK